MQRFLDTDQQTIDDLRIFGKHNTDSMYAIYNHAHTRGGSILLEKMFRLPLSDEPAINRRSDIIENFSRLGLRFPFQASMFDTVEKYLLSSPGSATQSSQQATIGEKEIQNGVNAIIELIRRIKVFAEQPEIAMISAYADERNGINGLLADPALAPVFREKSQSKLSYGAVTAYDTLFRIKQRNNIEKLLGYIYSLDVYMAVAAVATENKFVFPKALPREACHLVVKGVYHPGIDNAVGNDISMNASDNLVFLTGANMAGKSTFLRSLGTALYVAHMGFPVAASYMEFSVKDAIYTTINLPDNLGMGASHFYAEVLRVKKIATELQRGKSCFVVFDELFRGTNVKDAHEATVAVIDAFSGKRNSLFIVSSHIVEAGDALKHKDHIGFFFLPTHMSGHTPGYTYTLEKGITNDRHGMVIIRNERILEILENGHKSLP